LIFGEYYNFDAAGNFEGTTGLADGELGQQAAASNYSLHFGNFGGIPVKVAYFILGAALTAICATGTYIWLGKRRRRGHHEPALYAAWNAVICGVPLALVVTFAARLAIGPAVWFSAVFWAVCAIAIIASVSLARRRQPA